MDLKPKQMQKWCCIQKVTISSFNVEKRSISECLCSLFTIGLCNLFLR